MIRTLLGTLVGVLICIAALAQESYDIIIRGGKIIDGTGNPWIRADVGIRGDRIVRIGDLSRAGAARTIEAARWVVAPGFIDPYTHAIRGTFDVPTADNVILQGVTTIIERNDGSSPFPIRQNLERLAATKISPTWALYLGQGTIRENVIGMANRDASPEEIAAMKKMVAQAMKEGALGLSTGLFYIPGNIAKSEEVIKLSKVAPSYGGKILSPMN